MLYAAMMPISALAYDENCKWDQLAAMMPYSVRDIVLSKYLFGYICLLATGRCRQPRCMLPPPQRERPRRARILHRSR